MHVLLIRLVARQQQRQTPLEDRWVCQHLQYHALAGLANIWVPKETWTLHACTCH